MTQSGKNDDAVLFSHMQNDYIMPFYFIKRDSVMSDDQVVEILGDLITAAKLCMPIMVGLGALGLMLIICGGCMVKKMHILQSKNDKERYQ